MELGQIKQKLVQFIEKQNLQVYDVNKLVQSLYEEVQIDLDNYEAELNGKLNINEETGKEVEETEGVEEDSDAGDEDIDEDMDIDESEDEEPEEDYDEDLDEEEPEEKPKPKAKKPKQKIVKAPKLTIS